MSGTVLWQSSVSVGLEPLAFHYWRWWKIPSYCWDFRVSTGPFLYRTGLAACPQSCVHRPSVLPPPASGTGEHHSTPKALIILDLFPRSAGVAFYIYQRLCSISVLRKGLVGGPFTPYQSGGGPTLWKSKTGGFVTAVAVSLLTALSSDYCLFFFSCCSLFLCSELFITLFSLH